MPTASHPLRRSEDSFQIGSQTQQTYRGSCHLPGQGHCCMHIPLVCNKWDEAKRLPMLLPLERADASGVRKGCRGAGSCSRWPQCCLHRGFSSPPAKLAQTQPEVHVDFTELRSRLSESAWVNTKLPSTLDTKGCWLTDPAHLPVWDVALPVLSVAWWEQGRREEDPGLGVTLLSCA